jgi:hypothetical protein
LVLKLNVIVLIDDSRHRRLIDTIDSSTFSGHGNDRLAIRDNIDW